MAQSYFIWNGKDSRSMGVIMRRAAPLIRPEERVEHMTIPGYSGDLTLLQGQDIYNSYIQTVEISVREAWRVREAFRWLRGSGKVIFSSDPDKQQDARIIGAVTLEKQSRNLDWYAGDVQFYCQPLKQLLTEETVTITSSGATVYNRGDVDSKPRITATFSGGGNITINGATIMPSSIVGGTFVFDCDACIITNAAGTSSYESAGTFPVLKPGANAVTGSGWTSLVFERRERFL
jgi:phage-related protein